MAATTTPSATPGETGRRGVHVAIVVLAAALQLVVLVPFTIASGLLAPLWAVAVLYALWLVAAGILVVVARRRPLLTPVVPVANAAVLLGALALGETLLGWTP